MHHSLQNFQPHHTVTIYSNSIYHIYTSKHHHIFNILKSTQLIQNNYNQHTIGSSFVKQYIFCKPIYMKIIILSK
jgi:hypothetical protein